MWTIPLLLAFAQAPAPGPEIPAGLWRNNDEGFVLRIAPCGDAFCGFAAGAPPNAKQKPEEVCGKQMLKDFRWNPKKSRWEGTMQPPGKGITINSTLVRNNNGGLTLNGKLLLMSKTMSLTPFTGKIGANCRIEK